MGSSIRQTGVSLEVEPRKTHQEHAQFYKSHIATALQREVVVLEAEAGVEVAIAGLVVGVQDCLVIFGIIANVSLDTSLMSFFF